MRRFYAQEWYLGYCTRFAETGKDCVRIKSYPSRTSRDKAVEDYRAPNHTPSARMESVPSWHPNVRRAIRNEDFGRGEA